MPSVFSHAIVAVAAGHLRTAFRSLPARFWILSALCAMVPDADVVAFVFRVPYGSMLGHRGLSHSLLAAAVFGPLVALAFYVKHAWSVDRLE